MTQPPTSPLDAMIRKLGPARLSGTEQGAIRSLPVTVRSVDARRDIVHEGGPSTQCCILLDGWVGCYRSLSEGRRQILSLYVPGDLPDLQSLHLPDPDFTLSTLTEATIAFVPHTALHALIALHPAISNALWRETLITAAIHRAWMTGLGRRDARARLAHLFCELYLRLEAMGLAHRNTVPMLLTQSDLADALGMTSVHVSRSLRDLRRSGLIDLGGRKLVIRDWPGLKAVAEFDARYLRLA